MKSPRPLVVLTLAAIFVAAGMWLATNPPTDPGSGISGTSEPVSANAQSSPAAPATPRFEDLTPAGIIAGIFEKLRNESIAPGELDSFRRTLLATPADLAIEAIMAFLATGRDVNTPEQFEIGADGTLTGAPTLRVLLLDLLGRLSRENGTQEAVVVSRKLMESKTSADEWAVALRNTAWITPGERAYLAGKAREMITYQPWRQQPSTGFLESFDIIVFVRDVTFIPDLAEMIRGDDTSLQRSAGMALDRFAEMSPLAVMNFLNTNREELADRPFLRADYYSKADLSQPEQRIAVEAYLSRPDVGRPEKEKLVAAFLSPGTFAADTLVTDPPPEELPPSYFKGLRQSLDDWIKTNRFPSLTPSLLDVRAQLGQ